MDVELGEIHAGLGCGSCGTLGLARLVHRQRRYHRLSVFVMECPCIRPSLASTMVTCAAIIRRWNARMGTSIVIEIVARA